MKKMYKISNEIFNNRYIDYDNNIEFYQTWVSRMSISITTIWWVYIKTNEMKQSIQITEKFQLRGYIYDKIDTEENNKIIEKLNKQFFDFVKKIGYEVIE